MFLDSLFLLALVLSVSIMCAAYTPRVLVIGSTGRLGRVVTSKLIARGVEVVALVRDLESAKTVEELKGATLREGDILDVESLKVATSQVDSVVDVHGVKPPRFIKLGDLFRAPRENDSTHPYNINYKGTRNLLEAMKMNKNKKLIRLTGALVGASAFKPFVALFNFLLSYSNKWHQLSEKLIRESGVDYTVVRPSEIADEPSAVAQTYPPLGEAVNARYLMAVPGDSEKRDPIPVPSKISKYDVADLCVEAVIKAQPGYLSKSTVICCSQAGDGPRTFDEIFGDSATMKSFIDTKAIVPGKHGAATVVYSAVVSGVVAMVFQGTKSLFNTMLRMVARVVAATKATGGFF